jgi:hypothetical protein
MINHPETRKEEVFVGNLKTHSNSEQEFIRQGIKYRLGNISYFIDGKEMKDTNYYKPLFIIKESFNAYDKLQNEKLKKIRG